MLTFDPGRRLRARDALNHNFLAEHLNREPIALRPLNIEHEVGALSVIVTPNTSTVHS